MESITVPANAQSTNNGDATLVADTSTELRPAYATRLGIILSADVADVWVTLSTSAAVVGQGVAVRADGDDVYISGWAGQINVISTGEAVISYTEFLAEVGEDGGEEPTGTAAFVPSGPSDNYYETAVATTPENLASTPLPGGGWAPVTAQDIEDEDDETQDEL
jgi:hypothetical protein